MKATTPPIAPGLTTWTSGVVPAFLHFFGARAGAGTLCRRFFG